MKQLKNNLFLYSAYCYNSENWVNTEEGIDYLDLFRLNNKQNFGIYSLYICANNTVLGQIYMITCIKDKVHQ